VYESWYGFAEKPFNLTPDPKYLYLSQRHAEAFAHLEFGHRERGGFILITGEVGTGKTTLARYFLSQLPADTHTAVVLYPALTAAELLGTILQDLHVEANGDSLKSRVDALHRFLLEAREAGRNVVLLIDESQDLSPEVLEQVRLISNLETSTEKLIQIVLMGQSELREKLNRYELRQLAQRVTARYHLAPLGPEETEGYIRHRIRVAGGENKVGFTSEALHAVHRHSGGVPRLVNLICDRALLAGYVRSVRTISAEMVNQAAAEVSGEPPRKAWRWHHGLIATALTVALAAIAFAVAPRLAEAPATPSPGLEGTPAPPPDPLPSAEPTPLPRSDTVDNLLRTANRDVSFRTAVARIEAAWNEPDLTRTSLRTHLDQLRRLDLPAVLEMFHPLRPDTCFVALLGLDGEAVSVEIAGAGPFEVPASQVDALWTREAIIPWPETRLVPSDPPRRGIWVRETLSALGYGGDDTAGAVERFQQDVGLVPDGVAGPRTRLVLFARSGPHGPRLDGGEGEP
jgi:general secretion pathway protein A